MGERWSSFLGSWEPFADAVAPFLTNRDLFQLSGVSRAVLQLRYTLGRWSVELQDTAYERFRIMRYTVPPCFGHLQTFDLVAQLGQRLSVKMHSHNLNLGYQNCLRDVSALGGVHTLTLSDCYRITNVSALGGGHTLNLHGCSGVRDVSALGGVHTLNLQGCSGVRDVSAMGRVHALTLSNCKRIDNVSALGGVHTLNLQGC
jgi:hypothetical protein